MEYFEVRVCEACLCHVYDGEAQCPRCASEAIGTVRKQRWSIVKDHDVETFLREQFQAAETLLRSEHICTCGNPAKHYMVWPRIETGGRKKRLTNLPFCPARVMKYNTSINVPVEIILKELEVKDGNG